MEISKEAKELIENSAIALATIDKDGNPHCIAVASVKFVSDNQFLVTDNYMVNTSKNIQKNPNVALTVWNKDWQNNCIGYKLKGLAEYFTKGKWHEMLKEIPENKGEPCKGAILITINKIKRVS